MSRVYSTLFLAERGFIGTATYTADSEHVLVIRDLDAFASVDLTVPQLLLVGTSGQTIYSNQWSTEQDASVQWRGRQVVPAGASFSVIVHDSPVDVTVSGYVLSTP